MSGFPCLVLAACFPALLITSDTILNVFPRLLLRALIWFDTGFQFVRRSIREVFQLSFLVLQILQQSPNAFEFTPDYLVRIAEHVNSQW